MISTNVKSRRAGDAAARKEADQPGRLIASTNSQPREPAQAPPAQRPPIPLTDVWLHWPAATDGGAP
jgi:hypothetical protein